jgi:NADPH:quinone reductase-like Zn-dependent oxidoreductase
VEAILKEVAMKTERLILAKHGRPSESIALESADLPTLRGDRVRVRMLAAPVHPSDALIVMGMYGHRQSPPFTLGTEGVGVVETAHQHGAFRRGDRVVVVPRPGPGTWATMQDFEPADLIPVPPDIDVAQAAFAGANPITALALLDGVGPGQWIVQNSANAASARNVAGIAARRGINVINVVRRPDAAKAFESHEHVIVNDGSVSYKREALALAGNAPIVLGLEVSGGQAGRQLIDAVGDGALVRVYGAVTGEPGGYWAPDLTFRRVRIEGFWLVPWLDAANSDHLARTYDEVFDMIRSETICTDVGHTFALADYADAIRTATRPQRIGKAIFEIAEMPAASNP